MDNLNTHHPSSLYEAFEPAEARRIAERLEIHYTPKHGSWLDMAEIEIGVMSRQCLDRRIPDQSALRREVGAWQQQRNRDAIRVDWRFTTSDARVKLRSPFTRQSNTDGLLALTTLDGQDRLLPPRRPLAFKVRQTEPSVARLQDRRLLMVHHEEAAVDR